MQKVKYAALKYYNNIISEECLYVGMLFHNLTTDKRDFRYIKNFKRFEAFDDEADINFVKAYLKGIKQQVEINNFNCSQKFEIDSYIRFYVNEFRFTKPNIIDVEEHENYVENFTKMFLKYDYRCTL